MNGLKETTSPKQENIETWSSRQYELFIRQYEMLINSIANNNAARESSNNFWITVNTLILSGIAYVRDMGGVQENHKYMLMWTLIILGVCLCTSWIKYLSNLKKNIELKNNLLIKLEKYCPIEIFTPLLTQTQKKEGKLWSSLTTWVISVPFLFLVGYILFIGLLLFFPYETAAPQ